MGRSAWIARLQERLLRRHHRQRYEEEPCEEATFHLDSGGSVEARMTQAVIGEYQYLAAHPCRCGGMWQRVGGWIGGDGWWFRRSLIATLKCSCIQCGARKTFRFRLR